jgi:nitronate monooxygenase
MTVPRTDAARRLGISHPVIQGPFGGGLSTPDLTATVSNLGGLGSYGAHVLEPDEIGALAAELRRRTARPFALNLWVSDHDPGGREPSPAALERAWGVFDLWFRELGLGRPELPTAYHPRFEEQVEALLDTRPPVFSFVFGIPPAAILAECRRREIVTIGAATTLAEARALDEAGVDLVLATGFEAGGHRPSFLAAAEESLVGTLALTPMVADRVRAPVIAAGGIVDRRGIRAVLALGAQAAQLGTAFLACAESGTTDAHRAVLFGERGERTALTRAYTGRLARGVPNGLTDRIDKRLADLPPFPAHAWFVSRLKAAAAAAGRTDLVPLYASQAAPNLRHRTAAGLMAALIEG